MNELSIWLDSHCPPRDLGVFKSVADLRAAGTTDIVKSVSSGLELVELVTKHRGAGFDHVVIAGHGGTTWILDDEFGVTTGFPTRAPLQVMIDELAHALSMATVDGVLVSLAACLCSRSPTWLLKQKFGARIGSDWGPRAYLPGGQASFSARLRDRLCFFDRMSRVRGHRASGHASALALLAQHTGNANLGPGSACETLFQRSLPDVNPGLSVRRWWAKNITGELAQRWLMGDDSVEEEIAQLWDWR